MNTHPGLLARAIATLPDTLIDELELLLEIHVKPEDINIYVENETLTGFRINSKQKLAVKHRPTGIEFVAPNSHRSQHRNRLEALYLLALMLSFVEEAHAAAVRGLPAASTNDSTGGAVVDKGYHWRLIDDKTPRGRTLQLINRAAGCAHYGILGTEETFYTHWAPAPTFKD